MAATKTNAQDAKREQRPYKRIPKFRTHRTYSNTSELHFSRKHAHWQQTS